MFCYATLSQTQPTFKCDTTHTCPKGMECRDGECREEFLGSNFSRDIYWEVGLRLAAVAAVGALVYYTVK